MSKKMLPEKILHIRFDFEGFLNSTLFFGLVVILGIVLRFYDLGAESFWLDEVATTIEVRQSVPDLLTTGRLDQPPAYYLPIHFWVQIFGISEIGLRSFSALAGTGSIILIYLVGRRLFGKKVGLLSAFFMAISDFQILFSQEARNYSLFEFAALLSFLFFILYLRSMRKTHFVLYILVSIFMVYTNAYGVFILAAQNLFFVLQIRRYKSVIISWVISQVLILFAIIPYFAPIVFGNDGIESTIALNLSGILPSSFSDIIRSVYRFILPPRRYFGADMEWGNPLIFNYAIAGVFLVAGILIYAFRQGMGNWLPAVGKTINELFEDSDVKRNILLVSCWLLCPPILLFIASKMVMPMYEHRYVISAAPALYLLLALGMVGIRKVVPLLVSLGVMMILIFPGLSHYYSSDVNEQWKEVAVFIEENPIQNGVILFAPNDSSVNTGNQLKAFNYYYKGSLPSCGIGPDELSDNEVWNALEHCISNHDRFWVIIRHTTFSITNYSRYESFFLNPNQTTFQLMDEQHFQAISAYLFELER
jgi:mannosyltransferase